MTARTCLTRSCVVFAGLVATLATASALPRHLRHHHHHVMVVTDRVAPRAVYPAPVFSEGTSGAAFLGGILDAGISAPVSADPYEYRTRGYYEDGRTGKTVYGPGYDYYGNE